MMISTYTLITDVFGVEHYVAKDHRSLCGHLFAPATFYGYSLGYFPALNRKKPWEDEDCPRCEVQLARFLP